MSRFRLAALAVLIVYTALLLLAVLAPSNSDQSTMVVWLSDRLRDVGVPDRYSSFPRLEVLLNAAIVAPVSLLGSLLFPRLSWRDWTAYGFLASSAVEITQALVLSGRQASFSDVVANTSGALIGAGVVAAVRRAGASRRSIRR